MRPLISKKLINRLKKMKWDGEEDITDNALKPLKLRYFNSGVSCNCYANKKIVVKIGEHKWKLNKIMKRYKKFFPRTIVVNNSICVQERCDINDDLYDYNEETIERIAWFFGIDDIHSNNVGWKKIKGEWTPIFFDMGFKVRPTGKLSRTTRIPSWIKFGMRIK